MAHETDENDLRALFEQVAQGQLPPETALARLKGIDDMGFAQVDCDRQRRCGFAEVIFAQSKTPQQVVDIAGKILQHGPVALITRAPPETAEAVLGKWPEAVYNAPARTLVVGTPPAPAADAETLLVVSAGTSDLPVAQESAECARAMGCHVAAVDDVAVAGLHRLLAHRRCLEEAGAIIVVAGMEGALPSVVGGLVRAPVIGVPTSVGYGASLGGIAALLGMLNSCAAGVAVVNIDNGFGAAALAARILRRGHAEKETNE